MATPILSPIRTLSRNAPRPQFLVATVSASRRALHNTPSPKATTTDIAPPATSPSNKPTTTTPSTPLTQPQKDFLDSALRVNQAGELAAVLIYTAQTPPLLRSHPHLRPLMKHMHDQEAGHFTYFNSLLHKHRIRPTAMYPIWHVAASALGWGTAIMGREAAMACTEAVETEIGSHYNEQVRVLLDWADKMERKGETLGEELMGLIGELRRIRDEELEHLDHAVENDSKEARPYELLTNVIRGGCRTAIWISEKV
ncbi:catabolite repression protein CAT5 [Periconia macrospinosa]|uniref:5-demethoxyubiquinone hydroxylase, mitochondrial n=1 Tax=Periconia macrospinosa TaxID=97972 RepID=A0A2V1D2V6_9PLEO|nr:catabolite repression protein CAT5 [Periconia macrospinosa]